MNTRQQGVTLIELVAVLVIVGVLAFVAAPRFVSVTPFEQAGFRDEAIAALSYAQKLAIVSGCYIRIDFAASGYQLRRSASAVNCRDLSAGLAVVARPDGTPFSSAPPGGVAVSSLSVFFDTVGRPRDVASGLLVTNPAALTVAIGPETIQIEPETGFVHL